ncbi:hypothetical protein BCV71DRAFT_228880, partial [Rhizopus microsporus]
MCISKICNLACQRDITRKDVDVLRAQILEWISWLKELTDDEKIQPWAFNLNQNFLLHLPDLILFLRSMPSYAAFSIERTIQEYKARTKSRKDPFTNSNKIKASKVLLDDDEENEYEIWEPINRVELRNNEEVLDFDCFPYLKAYFGIQSHGSNNAFDPEVNTKKQRRPNIDIKELAYFGEAIVYLRYRFPDGCLKLLALVKIFSVECTK